MFGCFGEADEVTAYPARLRNVGGGTQTIFAPRWVRTQACLQGAWAKATGSRFPPVLSYSAHQGDWPHGSGLHHDHDLCRFKCRDRCILILGQQLWLRGWQVRNQGAFFFAALGGNRALVIRGIYVPICFLHACESLFVNMFWDHRATCALNGVFNGRHSVRSRYRGPEVTLPSKARVQTRTSCANKLTAVPFLVC